MLLIISGLTILFELALLLVTLLLLDLRCDLDLHLHLWRFKLSKPLPQNSHSVNTKKNIITHLEIISVLS